MTERAEEGSLEDAGPSGDAPSDETPSDEAPRTFTPATPSAIGATSMTETIPEAATEAATEDATGTGSGLTTAGTMATFRLVYLTAVAMTLPDPYPMVTLQELESPMRELSFPIGLNEGTAMANALRKLATARPLTHELLHDVLRAVGADVLAARLVGRRHGTYLAELELMTSTGHHILDCRASDAIIVAIRERVSAPLLVDERLFFGLEDVDPIPISDVPPLPISDRDPAGE